MSNDHNADECKRFAGERERFEAWFRDKYKMPDRIPFNWEGEGIALLLEGWQARAAQPAPVVPERLAERIDQAITDFTHGRASMRVPPLPHDVDMVLGECLTLVRQLAAAPAQVLSFKDDPRKPHELSAAGCRCVRFGEGNPHWPCPIHAAPAQGQQVECQECERLKFAIEVAKTDELDAAVYAATESLKHELWEAQAELAALKAQQEKPRAEVCMGCVEQASRIRELEHKMDYYKAQQAEQKPRDWPDDEIVSAWKWCEENGGTPAEFLSHSLLVKRSRVLGRPLTWREAIELTAMTTNMPDDQRDKLLAMDDTAPQPAPAQDVAGLVEALRKLDELPKQSGHAIPTAGRMRAEGLVIRAARELVAAHEKQSGGEV